MRRDSRGFTFIEMSFTLAVLGMIAILLAQLVPALREVKVSAETARNLDRAERSLSAFAAIHGRLPCADTDDDGFENSCAAIGTVPYATLGASRPLVNAAGFPFRYAVHQRAGTLGADARLAMLLERSRPDIGRASAAGVALQPVSFTQSNRRLDFCQALRAGMRLPLSTSHLYIETRASGGGGERRNVAYALVDPGRGDRDLRNGLFDGYNGNASTAQPRFEAPDREQSLVYDDRVIVAQFDQLWDRLGCSANMATAGRAHPNLETMLALVIQTMEDYGDQLDINVDIAFADNFAAGAGVASAVSGLAATAAGIPIGIASAINKAGATSGSAVSTGIAIGLLVAQNVVAGINLGKTVDNSNRVKALRGDFNTLVSGRLRPLYLSVQDNVQRGGRTVYSDE